MSVSTLGSEQALLSYYNIPTLNPEAWPTSKNTDEDEDDSDTVAAKEAKAKHARRYTMLGGAPRVPSRNDAPPIPSNKPGGGPPIPKDEQDPLSGSASIIALLRHRRISVDQDAELSMLAPCNLRCR